MVSRVSGIKMKDLEVVAACFMRRVSDKNDVCIIPFYGSLTHRIHWIGREEP